MPLPENQPIEDCPICNDVFKKDDVVYRPLLDGRIGKPYHKDCLERWCKQTGEMCIDPFTRIKFNIQHSKIKCEYDRPFRVDLHAGDEIIRLGTEPCDRFYDIKKFISIEHNVPIEDLTLYHIKGNERTPVIDELSIKDDLELELSIQLNIDDISLDDLYHDRKVERKKIEKIAKELSDIDTLVKTEQLSPTDITTAAKQAVEIDEEMAPPSKRKMIEMMEMMIDIDESTIDAEINATKERLDEIDHTLSTLPRDDPKRAQLEAIAADEKNKYKELLIKGILILYEKVKHVLSAFLSRSGDFVTDPETHAKLKKFVLYVFYLTGMGLLGALRLIVRLGWEICKLIPKIIEYIQETQEYDEPEPSSSTSSASSSWFSSNEPSSSASSSWFSSNESASSSSWAPMARVSHKPKQSSWFPNTSWLSSSSSSSSFSSSYDPEPPAPSLFSAQPKIRKRESPNARFLRENGVDVSGAGFSGLLPGQVFRKGFMFSNKNSSYM